MMLRATLVAIMVASSQHAMAYDDTYSYEVKPPAPVYEDQFTSQQQRDTFNREYETYYRDQTYGKAIRGEDR